jgi:branched-chain amino acid transport system substrate-binding protein
MRIGKFIARIAAICGITMLAIPLLQCSRQGSPKGTKVGVILPLTGTLSEMGQYEKQAMELAADRLRASGANQQQLVFEDGKGDSKTVASAAQKLLDIDGVRILITSTTGASLAAKPLAERKNVPLLAFCMGSDVAHSSRSTVRFYVGIEEESQAIVDYLSSLPQDTRVGVLYASVAVWTTAINDIYIPFFEKHFRKPAVIEDYSLQDRDFRIQLTRLKNADAQVLVILGYGFEYQPIFTQMAELGLRDKVKIIGGWGFLYTPLPIQTLEGIRVAGPINVFRQGPSAAEFNTAFSREYGHPPNFDAAFAYEVIMKLPDILRILDRNGIADLKSSLTQRGEIQGVIGPYHFTNDGNMIVQTAVGTFRNGLIEAQ